MKYVFVVLPITNTAISRLPWDKGIIEAEALAQDGCLETEPMLGRQEGPESNAVCKNPCFCISIILPSSFIAIDKQDLRLFLIYQCLYCCHILTCNGLHKNNLKKIRNWNTHTPIMNTFIFLQIFCCIIDVCFCAPSGVLLVLVNFVWMCWMLDTKEEMQREVFW